LKRPPVLDTLPAERGNKLLNTATSPPASSSAKSMATKNELMHEMIDTCIRNEFKIPICADRDLVFRNGELRFHCRTEE
jgi:hypothetical protein